MTINATGLICKTASCPAFGDWAIRNGLTVKWGSHKVGDIVLYDFNDNGTSDHIGIVYKLDGNYIYTVEGNTGSGSNTNGDGVYKRHRHKSCVNYFVRPKYTSEVTAAMVVKTALAQVGYKEGKSNNNKYGQWFGANHVSWCCIFIVWCFAHVIAPTPTVDKPVDKYVDKLPVRDIEKGDQGKAVKNWQHFLNWYHPAWNLAEDGKFQSATKAATKSFQATEGLTDDGCVGPKTKKAAKAYLSEDSDSDPRDESTSGSKVKIVEATSTGSKACKKRAWYFSKARTWSYWIKVVRCTDPEIALAIAKAAKQGVKRSNIKYSQSSKGKTLPRKLKAAGWDMSKVTAHCYTSCTPYAMACVLAAGVGRGKKNYDSWSWASTKTVPKKLKATGKFQALTGKKLLQKGVGLMPGDILIGKSHGVIVVEVA